MTRREKKIWILYSAVLIVLFVLSTTDLIMKEKEMEVYPISVIVEDTWDGNYVNFRKGMERAAMELNADIRFVTLQEEDSQAWQEEWIVQDWQDGSQALIVSPASLEDALLMREEREITVPMVLINVGDPSASEGDLAICSFDYTQMGFNMGEAILKNHPEDQAIYVIGRKQKNSGHFLEGIQAAAEPSGRKLSVVWLTDGGLKEHLEEIVSRETSQVVIVALDAAMLAEAAQILAETAELLAGEEELFSHIGGLYGRGNGISALNCLDQGIIRGLCVTDDYSLGYVSVKAAVEMIKGRPAAKTGYLNSFYIEKEDLRKREYEKMLYPID